MQTLRRTNRRRSETLLNGERRRDQGVVPLMAPQDADELKMQAKKGLYALGCIVVAFIIVMARLYFLQIGEGERYSKLADSNRVRYLEIIAPRGNILDRKGREMVTNRPSFNVIWLRESNRLDDEWLKTLTRVLGEDTSVLLEKIRKMVGQPGHLPVRLAEDISWDKVAQIEVNRMYLPQVSIEVVPLRVYHYGDMASHLIGYLGEINREELDRMDRTRYRGGDLIGKAGLERLREGDLSGSKGRDYMEVNALGFEQKSLKGERPVPGNDLQLTLDIDLQKIAEEELSNNKFAGAVVAMEVNTGRLLALASSPPLHLQDFVGGISHANWKAMLDNPLHPLVNKIVQGQYPPASTYKPITALAGLAEGVITPNQTIFCPGYHRFGNRVYRCWKRGGHGSVDLKRAVAESCDVYFYVVGQRLGVDRLAKYARLFGLGSKTGVEMEHEKSGLVPTTEWKRKERNEKWHEGETLSVAIGQGYNLVTPLQLTVMTSAIANGGTIYKPAIVEKVIYPDGTVAQNFHPEVLHRFTGQGRNLKLIRDGMVEAVNGKRGTGRRAQAETEGIVVGGKTGTAQVVRLKQYQHLKEKDIPYKYRDHAWFTCYAPASNPDIAVTVLVEHGLHGSSAAAPIASKILTRYFNERMGLLQDNAEDNTLFSPQMLGDTESSADQEQEPAPIDVPPTQL
ncbi:MAG: penicillin-binding protein 2 [Desulfobulbaceae bacterium]|nr:penicillin-binding protein 2 [Desulfobulbaceae bacterium]